MLKICLWSFLFVSGVLRGNANVSPRTSDMHCNDLCSDVDAYIPTISGKWLTCERGCRFFNIIFLTDGHNITETKKGCHSSCREAYNLGEFTECTAGCDATLEHVMQYGKKSDDFIMANVEIVESEVFIDLRIPPHNINLKFSDFKLKMPIQALLDEEFLPQEDDGGGYSSWMDWVMKLAKVSRFFTFLVFISLFIMVFLWAVVNSLHGAVISDDKPLLMEEKECCDSCLDEDEKSLSGKEEVKIVGFSENGQKNPKA